MSIFLVASLFAGIVSHFSLYFLDRFIDTHKVLHLIIQGGLSGLLGLLTYIMFLGFMRADEYNFAIKKIKAATFGKKVVLPSLDEETHQH